MEPRADRPTRLSGMYTASSTRSAGSTPVHAVQAIQQYKLSLTVCVSSGALWSRLHRGCQLLCCEQVVQATQCDTRLRGLLHTDRQKHTQTHMPRSVPKNSRSLFNNTTDRTYSADVVSCCPQARCGLLHTDRYRAHGAGMCCVPACNFVSTQALHGCHPWLCVERLLAGSTPTNM